MTSFLTKLFPFLKRTGRRKHGRLEKCGGEVSGSRWSFVSSSTAEISELQENDLLVNVPGVSRGCHDSVDWLAMSLNSGSEMAANQNRAKLDRRPRKKLLKWKIKIILGKRKRVSSDGNKEEGDNRVNEERIRQMATASDPVALVHAKESQSSTNGKRKAARLAQEEKKSPASKGRRRFRIKRTRKDNYVSIEDEREESVALLDDAGNDWKAVPYMASLSLEDQILSDQEATWNVHPNRQIGDGIWRPDPTDSFNRSVECLHQAAGKNKRKRSLKIRSKKNNKKTAPKHYQQLQSSVDHLEDVTSANKKRASRRTKQVH